MLYYTNNIFLLYLMQNTQNTTEAENKAGSDKSLVEIGKIISALRAERGITQLEFSKKLGTTQSAVARIEQGEQNLSTEMLTKIGNALNRDIVNLSTGAINIKIEGGHRLEGSIETKTSKNGTMGLLAASLLNRGKTILKNVPKIEEVSRMIEVFESIGVSAKWNGNDLAIQPPNKIDLKKLDRVAAEKTRSIIMLIGPLVHNFKKFKLPQPGGCNLGSRTVKPHLFALEKLGVGIETKEKYYTVTAPELHPAEIVLYESGDTVTENAVIAAAGIPGKTVIKYASANYMGQEVCHYLQKCGVKIEGIGTSTITVQGVKDINVPVTYFVSEDPIESMLLISAAIVTKSSITITRCPIDFLELELLKLEKMGFKFKLSKKYKANNGETNLVDIKTFPSKLVALPEKIHPNVYPGLNIDNLPFFAIIATQATGTTLIHDWIFEKRAIYMKDIDKLGANTTLVDPHRLYITGPTKLHAAEVVCPPALRPAAILLVGMLAAEGTSILRNMYSINRGYEDLVTRLNHLGAKISILREF